MEENICRLCLNLVKNEFKLIDAVTRQMLEVLSLKVDLDASENPILCQDCVELTKKFNFFKSACMDMEELIIISYSTAKGKAKIDIKNVYEDSKGIVEDGFSICRFCMNQIMASNCVSLDKLMNDEMYVEMLSTLMPEMILNIKDPVICTTCWENLECYLKFTQNCCDTEEKINKYRQNEGSCSTNQIRLSNVLRFLCKDKCSQITEIKQESLLEDVEHTAEFEMQEDQIKCEEALDIKDEDINLEEICENPLEVAVNKYDSHNLEENVTNDLEIGKECHSMLTHKDSSKVVIMYKCEICTYETKYESYLKRHMSKHKDKMHKCGICTFETKYKTHIKSHILIHKYSSKVEMHKCGICTYETKNKYDLNRHNMVTHKGALGKIYNCEICTYETKHKKNLKCHMLMHKNASGVVMYRCETCTFETKYKCHFKVHILKHKDKSEVEMHKCGICTFETKYKRTLKVHMLKHKDKSEVKMYKCETCTFETKYQMQLIYHVLVHEDSSEVEMYKCETCTFQTKYKRYFRKHMLMHLEQEKNNTCGVCTYVARCRSQLLGHMLSHRDASEVEMHKCTKCTFETKYARCLKRHMLIHKDS